MDLAGSWAVRSTCRTEPARRVRNLSPSLGSEKRAMVTRYNKVIFGTEVIDGQVKNLDFPRILDEKGVSNRKDTER